MKKTSITIRHKGVSNFCERQKLLRAEVLLDIIINGDSFKRNIKNFEAFGKKAFIQNNGLSNDEILKRLLEGSEILNKKIDFHWSISITIINRPWYKRWSSANAFTYPNTLEIKIYRDSFDRFKVSQLVGLIAHEQCHNLGFEHDFRNTVRRPYSVPYAVGSMVKVLAMGELDEI